MATPSSLLACFGAVAALYGLPPRVLPAIAAVEGGAAGIVHRNADGTDDLGPMQINERWLPGLARYTGLAPAEVRRRLLFVPCFNVAAAGAILRGELNASNDLMAAVGDYHSRTPGLNRAYRDKVLAAAARLFGTKASP